MSDTPNSTGDPGLGAIRAGALLCSLALGLFVVVNAQFGCDSQGDSKHENAPQPDVKQPANVEPTTAKQGDPKVPAEPNGVPGEAQPQVPAEASAEASAEKAPAEAKAEPETERVFMPASKSAGDFDTLPQLPNANHKQQAQQAQAQQAPQP